MRGRPQMTPEEEIARIRLPKEGQMFGVVTEMLGASKMRVESADGKTRLGRVRGKMRRRVWIRLGDVVIIEPWKVQSDERADIVWRYTRTQKAWLEKKGYLKGLQTDF